MVNSPLENPGGAKTVASDAAESAVPPTGAPRFLTRQRLGQLIAGLQTRFSSSAEAMSQEVQRLAGELSELENLHTAELSEFEGQRRTNREASTNEWDETLAARWDDAEMRSFKAVYDTASREGGLRREARLRGEQLTAELKKRIQEIDQAFLRAKDVPVAKLNRFRSRNHELHTQLEDIALAAQAALAKHSLNPPAVDLSPETMNTLVKTSATADASLQWMQHALADAQAACGRLANYPLAKFFNSPVWWLCMTLVSIAVALLLGLLDLTPWLVAGVVGATVAVGLLLLSMLGIRPWLKRFAAAEYPKVQQQLHLALHYFNTGAQLAVAENDAELKRLAAKREERFGQAKQWRDQSATELTERLNSDLEKLHASAEAQKQLASQQLNEAIFDCDRSYTLRLQNEWQQSSAERDALLENHSEQEQEVRRRIEQLERGGAYRLRNATHKALRIVARSRQWAEQLFPPWDQGLAAEHDHLRFALDTPVLPLGWLDLAPIFPDSTRQNHSASELAAPLLFEPLRDGYLTVTADPTSAPVQSLVRELLLRSLVGLPAGKTQVCVVDPPGLGRDFGWLMHLSDFDPQLVTHRVWTQPGHIAKQLTTLAMSAEDFIQQSLRDEYRDIVEYNADAGPMSEPYRILVWSSLPSGLDDQSWKSLRSLLETGARCGIIPILIIDSRLPWPQSEYEGFIKRRGLHLTQDPQSGALHVDEVRLRPWAVEPPVPANEQLSQQIIRDVGRRALLSNRVEVPLERMLPESQQRWLGDSSHALEIPIGQSGVGRVHSLKLGVGTAQHAMIAGKTGSGKSSLLHAIITSAVLKYSPERLRVVLLDFKKGVEFQVYSDAGLPHADIIGIESHREFGLSALEYIDACMQRRGEAFRKSSVQDIASWNARHPQNPLPRMLLLIDEFQELFVEEDKLASQASLILDRIVRQGRSFGIHAILSSQTLAGAYSLPRTTLGQMAVRIALQCDASDAQIIFADDNPAAARLKIPGQAVYNDAGGRVEGNQPMQIGWLTKEQQTSWLAELPSGYRNQDETTNRLGRCVIYDGNRAATWDATNADMAIATSRKTINADALWCVTGESVAIHPAVAFPLTQQAGRNVLVVAGEDRLVAPVLSAMAASFLRGASRENVREVAQSVPEKKMRMFVLQGAKPTDAWALRLPTLWRNLPCEVEWFDSRQVDGCLKSVHELLQRRMSADHASTPSPAETSDDLAQDAVVPSAPVLFQILQLGRLRELRRDDDFGMGGFGEEELKPDKRLEEILRDGPSYGVFTIIWSENYSTVSRWLSRSALRELEIRILMQMSGNDSTHLIDSIAASRLGEHVMLVFDEATGQEQRFRPFSPQGIESMVTWASRPA